MDINFGLKSKYLKVDAAGFNVIGVTVKQLKYVADSVHSQLTKKKENLQTKEHNNKTKTRHQNLIKMKNGNEDVRDFSDLNP